MTNPQTPGPQRPAYLRDLVIEERSIASLKPYPGNARSHSDRQLAQIAGSIEVFGFTNPVLIDGRDTIIAGHGRVEAARRLGLTVVPTIRHEHLDEAQVRAYVLADNKIALNAGWDPEILKIELQALSSIELNFDIEVTGFSTGEIDVAIDGGGKPVRNDPLDALPPQAANPFTVSRVGDVWLLGPHRVLCGDSRDPACFAALMGEERARMVFADAPYNVRVQGHVSGLGRVQHPEFAMASGEMSEGEFIAFLTLVFENLAAVSLDGSLHYQCMDWRHAHEMLAAGRAVYSDLKNICVWTKGNGGMGSFYRSQHELVFVWKQGTAAHVNTIELGRHGRHRTNVWAYEGVNTFKRDRMAELAMHPTVKPVAMIVDAIKDATRRGEIVLDCFGGSGSTLIAAERAKRKARLIEYERGYVDVIVRRWEALTGARATLASSGQGFAEVGRLRAAEVGAATDAALGEVA
jgi:hypothetical protein